MHVLHKSVVFTVTLIVLLTLLLSRCKCKQKSCGCGWWILYQWEFCFFSWRL